MSGTWWFVAVGLTITFLLWLAGSIMKRKVRAKDAELRDLNDEYWRQHRDRIPEDWDEDA